MSQQELFDLLLPLLPIPILMLMLLKWVRERLNLWLATNIIAVIFDFALAGYYTLTDDPVFAILWGILGCLYIDNCRKILNVKKIERELKEDIARLDAEARAALDQLTEKLKSYEKSNNTKK